MREANVESMIVQRSTACRPQQPPSTNRSGYQLTTDSGSSKGTVAVSAPPMNGRTFRYLMHYADFRYRDQEPVILRPNAHVTHCRQALQMISFVVAKPVYDLSLN